MTPRGYTVLSVGVHIHEIEDRTHDHPCVVSNHPFVATSDGKFADELNKAGGDQNQIGIAERRGKIPR